MSEKWMRRLEAKLDALLQKSGIEPASVTVAAQPAKSRELTPQEQEAINNAPKTEAMILPKTERPRVTAQNAPDTSTSVPKAEAKKSRN